VRYYSIIISDPDSGEVVKPKSLAGLKSDATYTSYVNGANLPGAFNVELDITVSNLAVPIQDGWIRVWGIALEDISQAHDLVGKRIEVYGGMKKGLPLAKEKQSGLILQGYILKAWGNWIGLDQTLDMVVTANLGTNAAPKNIVHNWKKGTPLADAIASTLKTAFPKYDSKIDISSKLILSEDDVGYYYSAAQYAKHLLDTSTSIVGGNYQGVKILLTETTFNVYDGSTQKTPVAIAFEDLIGQPTWIDPNKIQFKCAMRYDLSVGDYVTLPKSAITTTSAASAIPAGSSQNAKSIFQGTFWIAEERHLGNFRQPDAASWVTVFNASSIPASGGTA